jgi:hypothetical protein
VPQLVLVCYATLVSTVGLWISCARWCDSAERLRDDTDLTMSRLNLAASELAYRGMWGRVRLLFQAVQDFRLALVNFSRNVAMAPVLDLTTELGDKLRAAYRAAVQVHNAVVDVLQSLHHERRGA